MKRLPFDTRRLFYFHWCITGRTSLQGLPRVRYKASPNGGAGGGPTGNFTTARTWRKARAIFKANSLIGKDHFSYFVTHTMPAYIGDNERREHWTRWLATMRKLNPVSYAWVTEKHPGTGMANGLIHHHCEVVFAERWDYRSKVVRWSERYAQSSNGLHIERSKGFLGSYLGKYMFKSLGRSTGEFLALERDNSRPAAVLPFRWWGYMGVPTCGEMIGDIEQADTFDLSIPWFHSEKLWTSTDLTARWSAQRVAHGIYHKQRRISRESVLQHCT